MKLICLFSFFFLTLNCSFCQTDNDSYLSWSSVRKLTVNDFVIKTKDLQAASSFAQFNLTYEVKGYDFLTRNFNKKVKNYLLKSASWIDTTYDLALTLKYQQTLFDISEIYARHFRRDLKINRRKIASGTEFVNELNSKIMTDFSKRRIKYDTETKYGSDLEMQYQWENQIKKELDELKDYSNLSKE